MIRVYIVEDNEIMREALVEFLQAQPDFMVSDAVADGEACLAGISDTESDVALLDVRLPGMSGIQLVEALRRHRPDLPCLMLSGHRESSYVEGAFRAGARGYVLKGNPAELPGAIREVVAGRPYISPSLPVETEHG